MLAAKSHCFFVDFCGTTLHFVASRLISGTIQRAHTVPTQQPTGECHCRRSARRLWRPCRFRRQGTRSISSVARRCREGKHRPGSASGSRQRHQGLFLFHRTDGQKYLETLGRWDENAEGGTLTVREAIAGLIGSPRTSMRGGGRTRAPPAREVYRIGTSPPEWM